MAYSNEGIHFRLDGTDDDSVRELYARLVSTIVDHSERRYDGCPNEREATAFFAEVVVASGAIIADLLSKEDDRSLRRSNLVNFQKLLTRMVEEKADICRQAGRA